MVDKLQLKKQGKRNRQKGQEWEREIVKNIKTMDEFAKRELECQGGQGRDINTSLPLWIQCKWATKKRAPSVGINGFKEAKEYCPKGKFPICALKISPPHSREKPEKYAILEWQDFFEIYKLYWMHTK